MKRLLLISAILLLSSFSLNASNLPVSRQATLLEASSSSELYLEATGFYYTEKKFRKKADVKKFGVGRAIEDAKKAAIYYLLYGGTDPILSSEKELNHFKFLEDGFFESNNINLFITYEDARPQKTVLLNKGTGVKVILDLKVDKSKLLKTLEDEGVVVAKETLLDIVGNPFIMVLPQLSKGETVADALENSNDNRHTAGVIQSFLTAKQYDVLVPDQKNFVNNLTEQQLSLVGKADDTSYQLALSIGSDVYIDYTVTFTKSSYDTKQAAVSIRAFETTTSRLLGAETGYSETRNGNDMVSIEEAVLDAMTNVMNRIHNYWERDLERGVQYKVILTLPKDLTDSDIKEKLSEKYLDTLEDIADTVKENTTGSHTIDTTVWVSPSKFESSRNLYKGIREDFESSDYKITKDHQNRKLLLLSIKSK
ncbi:hypothetical protein DID80_01785 [Candidatus Marinamargulisbacteria bacterium SCGC AAA071-K20]|nr:hypothetical protein DID80_01785 [Candidatus Marinamargulisbacteria bacterium SCGC AAA071-K20]